jgi:hypothetical protein
MPVLDDLSAAHLISLAHLHRACGDCGRHTALDYCRSCDEFYWLHEPGCAMHENHEGHRLTIVPFVEDRSK